MSGISGFRAEFEASADKLLNSTSSVSGLSSVEVEGKVIYQFDGKVISATIYDAPDNSHFYAEVRLIDSTKIITGSDPSSLRDVVFWLDKCLIRFLEDNVICVLDMHFPAGTPF